MPARREVRPAVRHRARLVAAVTAVTAAVAIAPAGTAGAAAGHARSLHRVVASYLSHRRGQVSVAVLDRVSGEWTVVHRSPRIWTASIVKADILETLLHQTHGRLSSDQRSLAREMIEDSDNDAATALWHDVGGAKGVAGYDEVAGLTETTPDRRHWGLTTTSAADQVRLLGQLFGKRSPLTSRSQRYQRRLMRHVTSSQHWGVSAGTSPDAAVGLKNGWLPVSKDNDRWAVNSIGFVAGSGRSYLIAVLTRHDPSESYGIATIEHVSREVWRRVSVSAGS